MALRIPFGQQLAGFLVSLVDGAVQELVAEVVDALAPVRRAELDGLADDVADLEDRIRAGLADLEGLRQAVDVLHHRFDDAFAELFGAPDPARAVAELAATRDGLDRRARRMSAALDEIARRVDDLGDALQHVRARAEQAHQQATTARATAEAAVDGVSALEDALS